MEGMDGINRIGKIEGMEKEVVKWGWDLKDGGLRS